jgi:hypothetical protein
MLNEVSKCEIAQGFCKKSFDHKSILLSFKKGNKKGRKCINNRILNNPLLDIAVKLSIWECYLSEIDTTQVIITAATVLEECTKLSEIDELYNEAIFLQGKVTARVTDLVRRMDEDWGRIVTYDVLQRYPRKCEDDKFFELLIDYTNRATFKLQDKSNRAEKIVRNRLLNQLKDLKKQDRYLGSMPTIVEIENKLNEMEERENAVKVVNYLKSEVLNGEKITPHFLRLAKTLNNDSLEKIRKDDGSLFLNNKERETHIVNFYKNLYSLPNRMPADFTNCVSEFLGPEISRHPVVTGSKLDEHEKALMERPLDIAELDESVLKLNLRSAPGIDGVSNRFIVKYWNFFREPLHRYASKCVEKGALTDTFRTAIIRLIPKKGDMSKLKNWRPISLLSCYYKIISKALNTRLGKVIDKVTSLAQKAYNLDRYLHEGIINTVETIKHCQVQNTAGVLLAVDLHKAFDSVFHEFMREMYKFFGFGEYFI